MNTGLQVNTSYKYQELTVYFMCLPFLVCTKQIFLLGILALCNLGRHISQVQQKKLTYELFSLSVNTHASEADAVKYNPETV